MIKYIFIKISYTEAKIKQTNDYKAYWVQVMVPGKNQYFNTSIMKGQSWGFWCSSASYWVSCSALTLVGIVVACDYIPNLLTTR